MKQLKDRLLNEKERALNAKLGDNKKWGMKFYLMGLIPFSDIEAVGHLRYKMSVCKERTKDENKKAYEKVMYLFNDATRATFEAITENRNHFYTEYLQRYNKVKDKGELETHRTKAHYDLDIFILTAHEHKLVHNKQIMIVSRFKNEGLLVENYDTQTELLKAHGITEATYLKAINAKKDGFITINKKEYRHFLIDNSHILTYEEQREQLLRHQDILETELQRYEKQFSPKDKTKDITLKQLKKVEAELAELDKLIQADERHNEKMKKFRGLDAIELWNIKANELTEKYDKRMKSVKNILKEATKGRADARLEYAEFKMNVDVLLLMLEDIAKGGKLEYEAEESCVYVKKYIA